jgi:hypothetical protein
VTTSSYTSLDDAWIQYNSSNQLQWKSLGKVFLLGRIELAKKFVLENGSPEEHNEFYRVAGINRKQ